LRFKEHDWGKLIGVGYYLARDVSNIMGIIKQAHLSLVKFLEMETVEDILISASPAKTFATSFQNNQHEKHSDTVAPTSAGYDESCLGFLL
jgi:hypothetical protein